MANCLRPNCAKRFTISNDSGVIAGCCKSPPLEQSHCHHWHSTSAIRQSNCSNRLYGSPKVTTSKGGLFESHPKILDLKFLLLSNLISETGEYSSRIAITERGGPHLSDSQSPNNSLHSVALKRHGHHDDVVPQRSSLSFDY